MTRPRRSLTIPVTTNPRTKPAAEAFEEEGHWWVNAMEAARRLRMSRASVHRVADEGLLVDTFPLPHRRYFSVDSIERLLTARRADREFWKKESDPDLGESARAERRAARAQSRQSASPRRAAH